MVALEIVIVVLMADFVSGFLHWLEDAYGREDWPILGRLVTKPNILHHHDPRYFTRHTWFQSSWLLLCVGFVVLAVAWLLGELNWQVWLFVVLGGNANQVHKWAHRSPNENGPVISLLQRIHVVQTPRHHGRHHTDPKSSHYCVLTNLLNPILDAIRLWAALEWIIRLLFGVSRRIDTSICTENKPAHSLASAQARLSFGVNSATARQSGIPSLQYSASALTEPSPSIWRIWKRL